MALNWTRLAPNGTNLGLFKISFLFILAHRAQFEAISDIPGSTRDKIGHPCTKQVLRLQHRISKRAFILVFNKY